MHTCVDICTLPRLGQVSDRSPGRRRNFPTQYIFHKLHHHHRPHHHHHHQHPDKSHLHQDHYHLHRHQHHNHHANYEVVTQGPGPESPNTFTNAWYIHGSDEANNISNWYFPSLVKLLWLDIEKFLFLILPQLNSAADLFKTLEHLSRHMYYLNI